MHEANRAFWRLVKAQFPEKFKGKRVLEAGSYDVNGSVRQFFDDCDYIGLDWREGPLVDVVSLMHEAKFDQPFDVIISASMLEHDPHWQKSLDRMKALLKPDGILMLSWGAGENEVHEIATAPDNQFHALPAHHVLDWVSKNGLYLHTFRYEDNIEHDGCSAGCVGLVALMRKEDAQGISIIDVLHAADRAAA